MNGAPPIDITRAVRDELAVPGRYHLSVVPARPSLLDHVLQWLWDRWSDFWHMLTAHVKIGPAGAALVGDAVVVAAVVGVAMILAHLLVELQLRRMQRDEAMPLGSARSAHALANAAGWAADEGDYGRAIRLLFMAATSARPRSTTCGANCAVATIASMNPLPRSRVSMPRRRTRRRRRMRKHGSARATPTTN